MVLRNKRACSMSASQSRNTLDSDVKKTSSFSSKSAVDGSQVVSSLNIDVEVDVIGPCC